MLRSHDYYLLLETLIYEVKPALVAADILPVRRPVRSQPPRMWLAPLRDQAARVVAWLRTHPDWEPVAGPPQPAGWMHGRLWEAIFDLVELAQRRDTPEAWEDVARKVSVFLESDLRERSGSDSSGRVDVADDALKPDRGTTVIGEGEAEQRSWHLFARGLLGGVANPIAHKIAGQAKSYAMGVAGAASLILTALDEHSGSQRTAQATTPARGETDE